MPVLLLGVIQMCEGVHGKAHTAGVDAELTPPTGIR